MVEVRTSDFAAVAIRPPKNATNLDLRIFEDYQLSTLVAKSNVTDNNVDFITLDRHGETSTVYWYAREHSVLGFGNYRIEAEYSIPDLNVATQNFSYSMLSGEVFDMFEFLGHSINYPYNVSVYNSAGMDLGLYVITTTGGRNTAVNFSNSGGVNAKESVIFYPSKSSEFGVLITNENGGSGAYTLRIFVQKPKVIIKSPINSTYTTSSIKINLTSPTSNLDALWFRIQNTTHWITENITWLSETIVNLNDGSYSLFAWANDSVGQISAPAIVKFAIDTTAPGVTINSPLNQTYNTNTILVNLSSSASDLDNLWYRIYSITGAFWVDPLNETWTDEISRDLPDGRYILFARANDTHGNTVPVPANISFTLNAPPTSSILSPLNITYSTVNIFINLSCSASDLDKMWYQIYNGTHWVINKTFWLGEVDIPLADGGYILYAWANDSYGQVQVVPSNISFTIDTTAPSITILSPVNDTYHLTTILINFTSSAADLHVIWYRVYSNTQTVWVDSSNISWTTPIQRVFSEGSYTLYVWANDTHGNEKRTSELLLFTIDIAPEILSISIINGTTYHSGTILLNISSTATDLDTIWYRIYNGMTWITENITWTEPVTLELTNGTYLLYIWLNDTHGNEGWFVASFNIDLPTRGGPHNFIWVIVVIVGAVGASLFLFKYKKSQKKKKAKEKSKIPKPTLTFPERPEPQSETLK